MVAVGPTRNGGHLRCAFCYAEARSRFSRVVGSDFLLARLVESELRPERSGRPEIGTAWASGAVSGRIWGALSAD